MRFSTASLLGLAVALSLGFATVPARADNDNLLGRAQNFFQNWGNNDNDQNAYDRQRHEDWQREHATRDWDNRHNQAQRDDRRWSDRDRAENDRWHRDHDQQYGYNGYRENNDSYRGDWNR